MTLHSSCRALTSSKRTHFLPGQGQPYLELINNPFSPVLCCLLAFPLPVWTWISHTALCLPFIPHSALPMLGSSPTFYLVFLLKPAPWAFCEQGGKFLVRGCGVKKSPCKQG